MIFKIDLFSTKPSEGRDSFLHVTTWEPAENLLIITVTWHCHHWAQQE